MNASLDKVQIRSQERKLYLRLTLSPKSGDSDQPIIIVSTILVVVGENCRNKDLNCDHHNSIGLKSGEYGDKHKIEAPIDSIIDVIESTLCAGKLSITTTAAVSW